MPLPTPRKDEKKDEFVSRCIKNSVMQSEYDDNDQRVAICEQQWAKKKKD